MIVSDSPSVSFDLSCFSGFSWMNSFSFEYFMHHDWFKYISFSSDSFSFQLLLPSQISKRGRLRLSLSPLVCIYSEQDFRLYLTHLFSLCLSLLRFSGLMCRVKMKPSPSGRDNTTVLITGSACVSVSNLVSLRCILHCGSAFASITMLAVRVTNSICVVELPNWGGAWGALSMVPEVYASDCLYSH